MRAGRDHCAVHQERGDGWVVFAGTLLLLLGTLDFTEGLAAMRRTAGREARRPA
jgi:hypothetical protein